MKILKRLIILSVLFLSSAYGQKPYVDKELISRINAKYKMFVTKRFINLQKTLDKAKNKSDEEKLQAINKFYNNLEYMSDLSVYGKTDYWATPWQFLAQGRGDCEDYVISKYFALLYLEVDSKKLFFTYVKSSEFKAAHMVLTYFKTPRCEPLILDNNSHQILPASQREDLTPIYNFNGDSLYRANTKTKEGKVTNQKTHKKWDELKLNMRKKVI